MNKMSLCLVLGKIAEKGKMLHAHVPWQTLYWRGSLPQQVGIRTTGERLQAFCLGLTISTMASNESKHLQMMLGWTDKMQISNAVCQSGLLI